jgi:hypothetical protein
MKKRAIHAELRKGSKKFDGWLKYEITVQYESGVTEKIPAYGKDLQDALSRVVHDEKVRKVKPIVEKVPIWIWAVSWFITIGMFTLQVASNQEKLGQWSGVLYMGGVVAITSFLFAVGNWLNLKSIEKNK